MSRSSAIRRRRNARLLEDARQKIVDASQEIISTIIDGAKSGNYLQAKFLFDFAGLSGVPGEAAPPPSLAETLLERLQAPPAAPKNPVPAGDAATSSR